MVVQVLPRISIMTQKSSARDSSLQYIGNCLVTSRQYSKIPWNCDEIVENNFEIFNVELFVWLPGGKEYHWTTTKITAS